MPLHTSVPTPLRGYWMAADVRSALSLASPSQRPKARPALRGIWKGTRPSLRAHPEWDLPRLITPGKSRVRAPELQMIPPSTAAPSLALTSSWTSSPPGSIQGPRNGAHPTQLAQRPVTSGGCRETLSVTSSCTHPLPLPGGLGTGVRPYFPGAADPVWCGPSVGSGCRVDC